MRGIVIGIGISVLFFWLPLGLALAVFFEVGAHRVE